ncbi:hypothetical protein PG911_16935 [Tenacibaculum ovolyticum]|uniref:hypothetical protein n=1 Tax=Tenacibaculum ovolyticum TaxID=104270 RepID=UPI0022F3F3A9|nr:hypothetical protein [Tenacibaculum ovolyticum]WBX76289.1 hypothetical protein PG911_16935 [Tenacibaculum ovolyticum]
MLPTYQNSNDLLTNAAKNNYYFMLIAQLNKDFNLASFDFKLSKENSPIALKEALKKGIQYLISNNTTTYNNLLYVVDVPEEVIKNMDASNFDEYVENITFLVLKRIWKKVWFKNKYANNS